MLVGTKRFEDVAKAIIERDASAAHFIVRCELCGNVHHVRMGNNVELELQWRRVIETIGEHLRDSHGIPNVSLDFDPPSPESANTARFWIPY